MFWRCLSTRQDLTRPEPFRLLAAAGPGLPRVWAAGLIPFQGRPQGWRGGSGHAVVVLAFLPLSPCGVASLRRWSRSGDGRVSYCRREGCAAAAPALRPVPGRGLPARRLRVCRPPRTRGSGSAAREECAAAGERSPLLGRVPREGDSRHHAATSGEIRTVVSVRLRPVHMCVGAMCLGRIILVRL